MTRRKLLQTASTAIVLTLGLGLSACEDEGPAEKAGKKVDQAVEDAADAVDDAGDKAAEKVDDAADKVKEKINP